MMYGQDGAAKAYSEANSIASRETEVQSEIRQLFEIVDRTQAAAIQLFERITPVQRMSAPTAGGTDVKHAPQPVLCPIADQIRTVRERVEVIAMQLDSNRNQLEI